MSAQAGAPTEPTATEPTATEPTATAPKTRAAKSRGVRFSDLSAQVLTKLAAAGLGFVLLGALIAPRSFGEFPGRFWVPVWWALGLCAYFWLRKRMATQSVEPRKIFPYGEVLIALVSALITWVVARSLAYDAGWDVAAVVAAARDLVAGNAPSADALSYFGRYPNNLPLLVMDKGLLVAAETLGISFNDALAILSAALMFVTSLSVFIGARSVSGRFEGFIAQLLVLLFLVPSPWNAVPYTDLPTAAFLSAATAMWLLAMSQTKRTIATWALIGLAGVFAGCAIMLKPTAWILVVAVVVASLLGMGAAPWWKRAVQGIAFALVTAIVAASGAALVADTIAGRDPERAVPMIHFMRIGSLEAETVVRCGGLGSFSELAAQQMIHATTIEERKQISKQALQERLAELGPIGYAEFAAKKLVWNWTDGTFSAWCEGYDDKVPFLKDGPLSTSVQSVLRDGDTDVSGWAHASTGLWLAMLSALALQLWRVGSARKDVMVLVLSILGIAAFTVLFEGRPRYLLIFAPSILMLVAATLRTPLALKKRK